MTMNNFSFPPPPPPPPKAAGNFEPSNPGFPQRGRGRGRGDRGGRGLFRGEERGRAQPSSHFGSASNSGHEPRGHQHLNGGNSSYHRAARDGAFRGQKRKRDDFQRVPKLQAAPAVPSFGGPLIPAPASVVTKSIPSNDDESGARKPASTRTTANALGLTPYGDSSESEGGDDDEAAMAAAGASSAR